MDLQKIGIKFFAGESSNGELVEFIPVFHRWIQNKSLDQVLIDVADYSHIKAGPGIVLVAHEGNYSIDETGNQRGMVYYSKHEVSGSLEERIKSIAINALKACQLLVQDDATKGKMTFPGNELQIFSNDRLQAPNTEETWSAVEPAINKFLQLLFSGQDCLIERERDLKERFQITIKAPEPVSVDKLLQRIS